MNTENYQSINKALEYNNERFKGVGGKFIEDDEKNTISKFIGNEITKSTEILDLASGTGRISNYILMNNTPQSLTNVDVSNFMLQLARENLKCYEKKVKLEFLKANALKLPFPDNYFDIIVAFHFIKHVDELHKVIKEINRVLKNDGLFCFDFVNSKSLARLKKSNCYLYNNSEIVNILKENELKLINQKSLHYFGETPYLLNNSLAKLIQPIDLFLSKINFPFPVKYIVLSKKVQNLINTK